MTHEELLASIEKMMNHDAIFMKDALRAVVELHKPDDENDCIECSNDVYSMAYPCNTLQVIVKELK